MRRARVCCERVAMRVRTWSSGSFVAALEDLGKRLQEALVLRAGAVGDAQRPGTSERASAAHEDAALLEPVHDLLLVALLTERKPTEVGLRLGGRQAERAQALVDRDALCDRARDALDDRVLVGQRLDRGGLGERVAEEGLAHLIERARQLLKIGRAHV